MHGSAETNCQNVIIETGQVLCTDLVRTPQLGRCQYKCSVCQYYVWHLVIHFMVCVLILAAAKWRQQSCIHG